MPPPLLPPQYGSLGQITDLDVPRLKRITASNIFPQHRVLSDFASLSYIFIDFIDFICYNRCNNLSASTKVSVYYVDGGCSNNGKPNATGIVVGMTEMGIKVFEEHLTPRYPASYGKKRIIEYPTLTSNVCELEAIRLGLKYAVHTEGDVIIITDSVLAKNLVNAEWGTQFPHLAIIAFNVHKELHRLRKKRKIQIQQMPREKNLAGIYIEEKFNM
jgi:ribonuclease HI